MRRRGSQAQARPAELRLRLAVLRERAGTLATWAELGAFARELVARRGSPTWPPCEDLTWRTWTRLHGDAGAREVLSLIEQELSAAGLADEGPGRRCSASLGGPVAPR